ncbi:hypothetical protein C8T65DRAFT_539500, partial [Cerioporus squamosus]
FDVGKDKAGDAKMAVEEAIAALLEDVDLYASGLNAAAGEDIGDNNNEDGLVDERDEMDKGEREDLEESIAPVKLVLTKIRTLAYKIINSSTILLPAWNKIVEDLELPPRVLPRDVRTRWNLTYQMLDVALKYRLAVNGITGSK